MKTILVDVVEKLNKIESFFSFIFILGTVIIFVFISILLALNIYSISKIINDYNTKAYFFLKKLTDSEGKNDKEKNNEENILIRDKNNLETFPLLDKFSEEKNIEENELVEDLYKIYCKFYNISENSLIELLEKKQNKKNLIKIKALNESNELFKLFLNFALYIPQFKLDINIDYDFYKNSKLIKNFQKIFSKKSNTKEDKEQILYTKSIIKELLSTELVDDYGFVSNLNFNYITNINLKKKENKNYIQIGMFKRVEEMGKNEINDNLFFDNNKEEFNIDNIKVIFKNKNLIMKRIEENFEQDDYLNLSKLELYFNNTLINSFYNYTRKIIEEEKNS
jgi:Na+-transporting methylmalonyl-CoA/oxaloacetate decarboxylase gamma subunit